MLRALSGFGLLAILLSPSVVEAHDHYYGPPQAIVRPIPNQYLDPWYRVHPPGTFGFPGYNQNYGPPMPPPIPSPLLPGIQLAPGAFPSYNYYAPPPRIYFYGY